MRPRSEGRGILAQLAALVLAFSIPVAAAGQSPVQEGDGDGEAMPVVERADRLYFSGRADSALSLIADSDEGAVPPYQALWRSARASLAMGLMAENPEERARQLEEAVAFGRRAVERRDQGVEGHYWLAAAAGLLAVHSPDASRIVALGREARRHAWATLDIDPGHGGAHNVLGRAHFEVLKLAAWKRFIAGLLGVGSLVDDASWEQAERHLREAVARSPEVIYYRLDLARLLAARERRAEARQVLRGLLDLPSLHPPDPILKERARALLDDLRERDGGAQ